MSPHRGDFARASRREVNRCVQALRRSSPPDFWRKRLERAAEEHEAAARILREQLAKMEEFPCD